MYSVVFLDGLSCTQRKLALMLHKKLHSQPSRSFVSFHQRYTVPKSELDNNNYGFLYSDAVASLRSLSSTAKGYIIFVILYKVHVQH
jgi:hypothetical protein